MGGKKGTSLHPMDVKLWIEIDDAWGEEMGEAFKVEKSISHPSLDRDHTVSYMKLYSCPLDVAPERKDHFSTRQEGTIATVLEDMEPVSSRWNSRVKAEVYQACARWWWISALQQGF